MPTKNIKESIQELMETISDPAELQIKISELLNLKKTAIATNDIAEEFGWDASNYNELISNISVGDAVASIAGDKYANIALEGNPEQNTKLSNVSTFGKETMHIDNKRTDLREALEEQSTVIEAELDRLMAVIDEENMLAVTKK